MEQDKKTKAIEAFRRGCTWAEAAQFADVSRTTLWRWSQLDEDFAASIDEAKAGPDSEVEAVTYANCLDPDPAHNTLRMFWLKSRVPQVYGERLKIEHSGEIEIGWGDPQGDNAPVTYGAGAGPDASGAVQGAGVRPAVGQD